MSPVKMIIVIIPEKYIKRAGCKISKKYLLMIFSQADVPNRARRCIWPRTFPALFCPHGYCPRGGEQVKYSLENIFHLRRRKKLFLNFCAPGTNILARSGLSLAKPSPRCHQGENMD